VNHYDIWSLALHSPFVHHLVEHLQSFFLILRSKAFGRRRCFLALFCRVLRRVHLRIAPSLLYRSAKRIAGFFVDATEACIVRIRHVRLPLFFLLLLQLSLLVLELLQLLL
jgi:hypothetical protein